MSVAHPAVVPAAPRDTAQARLPDGRRFEAPPGTPLGEVLLTASPDGPPPVAAIVNGRLAELSDTLDVDVDLVPVTTADADGMRIYRRSLVALLVTASAELFPEAYLTIDHAATTAGGYYCELQGRAPFTQAELDRICHRMRAIAEADAPFVRRELTLTDATALFRDRGEDDKARLLAHRHKDTLRVHEFLGRVDFFHGLMVASAGCLRHFALHAFPPGFVLQFPHQSHPSELEPLTPYPKLFAVFEEYGRWLDRLGIRSVGALDDAIVAGRLPEISLIGEALHEARIARIAADIASRRDSVRLVLVAGPSSSGKTTFSKRLAIQLAANGLRPFPVALDDYFLDRHLTPRDERGELDFEHIQALDLPLFDGHVRALTNGDAVQLPKYDFRTGRRDRGPTFALEPDHIVIVEGIHGLNPELVPRVPADRVYRVYASALTQLNLDRHNRVSTTDCRLIRRIVRDAATRGYSAADTLRRWPSVVRGEKKWIFPFQENSDAVFNSALAHELAVLRPAADPLLLQVRHGSPEYLEANRLLSFLQWFRPAGHDAVPTNSILREFIGGSVFEALSFAPR